MQPTVDDLSLRMCARIINSTLRTISAIYHQHDVVKLEILESRVAVKVLTDRFRGPPTPGLFFDGGLDFLWDTRPHAAGSRMMSRDNTLLSRTGEEHLADNGPNKLIESSNPHGSNFMGQQSPKTSKEHAYTGWFKRKSSTEAEEMTRHYQRGSNAFTSVEMDELPIARMSASPRSNSTAPNLSSELPLEKTPHLRPSLHITSMHGGNQNGMKSRALGCPESRIRQPSRGVFDRQTENARRTSSEPDESQGIQQTRGVSYPRKKSKPQKMFGGFDGTLDDIPIYRSEPDNQPTAESMDQNRGTPTSRSSTKPKPLNIRKQSSQIHIIQSETPNST